MVQLAKTSHELSFQNERGVALLLALFIITLATIVVMSLSQTVEFDSRASHAFHERLKADYALRSAINFGVVLLSIPKKPEAKEDWFGEPWSVIPHTEQDGISKLLGTDVQLEIVDEDGKVDLNSIVAPNSSPAGGNPFPGLLGSPPASSTSATSSAFSPETYWKNVLRELFTREGFQDEHYDKGSQRTVGDRAYAPKEQVAVLHDWIDQDSVSHRDAAFNAEGIESGKDRLWFYNRPLLSIQELILVPGFTLERIQHIAPFVRVGNQSNPSQARVNVNTAPIEVLTALGLRDSEVSELIRQRTQFPITSDILSKMLAGDPQLQAHTKVTSDHFSLVARVTSPFLVRWARAEVTVSPGAKGRNVTLGALSYF